MTRSHPKRARRLVTSTALVALFGTGTSLGLSGCGPAPTNARRRVIPGTAKRLSQDRPLIPAGASRQDS